MPSPPELRDTVREAIAEDYLDVASRRAGGDEYGRVPPVRGVSSVSAIFDSGRVVRLRSRTPPVPLGDLDQLVGTVRRMGEDADAAIRARSTAIARLSRRVASDGVELSRAREEARRKRRARVLSASARLDRRIDKELMALRDDIETSAAHHAQLVRRMGRRAVWDDLVVLSALPLFAAFGQRGDPFASNNVVLLLSLLVWLLGDELTDLISGSGTVFGIRDTDIWSYVAPLANLYTGFFLLRHAQHERFITGLATDFQPSFSTGTALLSATTDGMADDEAPPERLFTFRQQLDLLPLIAADHRDDFQSFEAVTAVASITQLTFAAGPDDPDRPVTRRLVGLTAVVADAILSITVTVAVAVANPKELPREDAVLSALVAAWIVDTAEPKA